MDEGSYIVTGDLTIRDMTKTVSNPLELIGIESDPFGNLRADLGGTRRIDRKGWGVTWNTKLDSSGVLVSDKIILEFELSLITNFAEAAPANDEYPPPPPVRPAEQKPTPCRPENRSVSSSASAEHKHR